MEGLGRLFNVVAQANGVYIDLTKASAVTFVSFEADGSQILTLTEGIDGSGSAQNLAIIDKVYKGPGVGGTWTKVTQTAAATYDNADDATNDAVVVHVDASQLSAGFTHVALTNDGGNPLTAIVHDLAVQRDPANLETSL